MPLRPNWAVILGLVATLLIVRLGVGGGLRPRFHKFPQNTYPKRLQAQRALFDVR